jgi:hypothetical protein
MERETGPPIPKPQTVIWRYASLHTFLTLLTERRLMFHQFKKLEENDAREGMAIEGFWESMPDRTNDWKERSEESLKALRYTCYASCWSMSKIENALMWRGYARQGIAIKTTVKQLREAAQEGDEQLSIRGNEIVYADNWAELEALGYRHDGIPLNVLFMHTKRKAFVDEREARFHIQITAESFPALLGIPGRPSPDLTKICPLWVPIRFTSLDWINEVVAETSIPTWAVHTIRQIAEAKVLKFRQSGI